MAIVHLKEFRRKDYRHVANPTDDVYTWIENRTTYTARFEFGWTLSESSPPAVSGSSDDDDAWLFVKCNHQRFVGQNERDQKKWAREVFEKVARHEADGRPS